MSHNNNKKSDQNKEIKETSTLNEKRLQSSMSTMLPQSTVVLSQDEEMDVLRKRLITKECGCDIFERGHLSSCVSRFREYAHSALLSDNKNIKKRQHSQPEIAQELKKMKERLRRELMLHKIEMKKLDLMDKTADIELRDYKASIVEVNQSIDKLKHDIETMKQTHATEKRVRRNREQYEFLAKEANKHPLCAETQNKLEKLQVEINMVVEDDNKINRDLKIKEKQTHLLMQSIFDLKTTLIEEKKDKPKDEVEEESEEEGEEEDNSSMK